MFDASDIKIAANQAVVDAGATEHFVLPQAPVTDVQPTNDPLMIHMRQLRHAN